MKTQVNDNQRWSACLDQRPARGDARNAILVGVLPGEGIGPEIISSTIDVLNVVATAANVRVEVRYGGAIGREAERTNGSPLSRDVIQFCEEIFRGGGAILSGPGGGRYVYDLRRQFDLFFKISPIQVSNGLPSSARLHADALRNVDILITREGKGGAYQGSWNEQCDAEGNRSASHLITYDEPEVRRFLDASARLAQLRGGNLTVVWKESGIPSISALWRDCAKAAAAAWGVDCCFVDIDLMAFLMIQDAAAFDVIAAPNLFGDVLADLGAVFLGSRGVSYSGNFSSRGDSVYQTNHGAAYDLAGTDRANPVGQILSLSMMLRETFFLSTAAEAIQTAIRCVWDEGFRTAELEVPGSQVIGTREMGTRIAKQVEKLSPITCSD